MLWAAFGTQVGTMAKSLSGKDESRRRRRRVCRAPGRTSASRVRRDPMPPRRPPATSRPSLRVLLGEVERLQAELTAEQAQGEGARGERRHRSAHRNLQPARLRPRAQALARLCEALRHPRRADLHRSRRLQAGERPARPCGGRCRAQGGRRHADAQCARLRHGRAARRRRVRPDPVESERRRTRPRKPGRWKPPSARQRSNGRARRSRSAPRSALRCSGRRTSWPTCSPRPTTPCTPARRRGRAAGYHAASVGRISRNDIRRELILDKGDAVPQVQLALFQPLDLQAGRSPGDTCSASIAASRSRCSCKQARQLRAELAFFLLCHVPQRFDGPAAARSGAETSTSIAR